MTKEQSVLNSIMDTFEGENKQTQYNVLSYKIDLYFHDYRLALEIDEKVIKTEILSIKYKDKKH